jgi:hypothetical protein
MKCILCKLPATPGLIYCAKHFERSARLTLAEKLAEQKAAGWISDIPLPGFEDCDRERAEVIAAETGEALTAELASPKADIEAKAGEMETLSPLFRGNGPQGELF